MNNMKNRFYENHNKIEIPICFYEDDDGNKVVAPIADWPDEI